MEETKELAAGVSFGVSSILPPVYRASTSLLIRTATAGGDDYGTVIVNQYLAATYNELLTKRPIIEAAGLKGFRIGGAEVSPKHANFIINAENATASDIEALIRHVQRTVRERHGIELVPEVRIVGEKVA